MLTDTGVGSGDASSEDGSLVGGQEVQWEWEDDGAKWAGYSRKHAKQITDAYNAGKKEVKINNTLFVILIIHFNRDFIFCGQVCLALNSFHFCLI